jgi:hypothetical protein
MAVGAYRGQTGALGYGEGAELIGIPIAIYARVLGLHVCFKNMHRMACQLLAATPGVRTRADDNKAKNSGPLRMGGSG